jgi:hypothetical protein
MKKTTGHLFRRGDNFYVFWRFKGKAFKKALRDENGNAITTKREAEKARDTLLAPFAATSEVDALASIAGKLEGRKVELAKWESILQNLGTALRIPDQFSQAFEPQFFCPSR